VTRPAVALGEPGRYARTRSYVPVARSTSFLDEGATARRWTREEARSRIADAPLFRFGPPSAAVLDEVVEQYQAITGDRIRPRGKRNLLAACYRLHGADLIPYVADEFAVLGTAQNLLGLIRCAPPRESGDDEVMANAEVGRAPAPLSTAQTAADHLAGSASLPRSVGVDHDGLPCPVESCLPGLIYCEGHCPRFDPTSKRRYDRRPSNPDAAGYFGGQEYGVGERSWISPGAHDK
jgi:hypothetical protein